MLEWRRGRKRLRPHRNNSRSRYNYDHDFSHPNRFRRYDRSSYWGDDDNEEGALINWRRMFWQTIAAAAIFLLVAGIGKLQWAPARAAMSGIRYSVATDFDWRGLYDRVQTIAVWHPLGGTTNPPTGDGTTPGTGTGTNGSTTGSAALAKVKLTSPLQGSVTLPYGLYTEGNEQRFHTGLDIDAKDGDPLAAAADGTVKSVARNATYGLYVEVDHGNGVVTLYAHCSQVVVKPKDSVKSGQTIAKAGRTGNATGTHLHFEVQVNGQTVDPAPLIGAR